MRGKIRRIVAERGFMFVRSQEGGDYWCHASQCKKLGMDFVDLPEGLEVEFDPKVVGGNNQGHNVRLPEAPEQIRWDVGSSGCMDPNY